MNKYVRTFATRTAFDNSLAATGTSGEVGYILANPNPTSSVTCNIIDTGEAITLGSNMFVEMRSIGAGDMVFYDTQDKNYVGIKESFLGDSVTIKQFRCVESKVPSRYIKCGRCVVRKGKLVRIGGTPKQLPWDDSTADTDYSDPVTDEKYSVTDLPKYNSIKQRDGSSSWSCYSSLRLAEINFPEGSTTFLDVTRKSWNDAVKAGKTSVTGVSNTVYDLAEYHYNYEEWYNNTNMYKYPSSTRATSDTDGQKNTRLIHKWLVNTIGTTEQDVTYAANYCFNYKVDNVPDLVKGKWFFGTIIDIVDIQRMREMFGVTWMWSSTQFSAQNAWYAIASGRLNGVSRWAVYFVVPLADLYIKY